MENKEMVFNDETIKVMRDNAYELISTFIKNKVPFRLVIWNKDDWDYELPIEVMLSYPMQLVLDIASDTLNMCKVNDDGITIVTYFDNVKYTKFLSHDDTVAVLDSDGQPFLVNLLKFFRKLTLINSVKTVTVTFLKKLEVNLALSSPVV
jgi:hypothetical protein